MTLCMSFTLVIEFVLALRIIRSSSVRHMFQAWTIICLVSVCIMACGACGSLEMKTPSFHLLVCIRTVLFLKYFQSRCMTGLICFSATHSYVCAGKAGRLK